MPSRRTLSLPALAALSLIVPTTAAAAVKATPAARVAACTTGAADDERAAAFTGSMSASGAKRMQMRFALQQRLGPGPKGTFKKVAVPDWGSWEKADPGRGAFVFTKRIEALTAPAAYRVVVTFRWLDGRNHVLRTTTRTSPACEVADPRPDLSLGGIDAVATGPGRAAYTLAVANDGHSTAAPFAVTVTVGGVTSAPVILGPLTAGDRASGAVAAPRCAPGSTITVTLDAANAVDESHEADDVVQRPCPLA
ncbi:MAG TPA: CARDB domain-containing protein [Baekduia sp.]|uniref:CARDB domain-containing protein n=1 Tax=Baekduia sp. TaxID=2600305 RepID=UPI002D79243E|nr:CARDB domain-containing protein [Baekduia sp.]HET6506675.1 CARDB domain-containing protein [Baekduia sp.]